MKIKIELWFNKNIYSKFLNYCKKENFIFMDDLIEFDFDTLFNVENINKILLDKIKVRYQLFLLICPCPITQEECQELSLEIILSKLPLFTGIKNPFYKRTNIKFEYNDIKYLSLTEISKKVVEVAKIDTVRELINYVPEELLRIRKCGGRTIEDFKLVVRKYFLNMKLFSENENIDGKISLLEYPLFTGWKNPFYKEIEQNDEYDFELDKLFLKRRSRNVINSLNVKKASELLNYTPEELYSIEKCGKTTVIDFQSVIKDYVFNSNRDYSGNWTDFESMIFSVVKLKDRNFDILKQRLGMYGGKRPTLQSIGKKYNLTRERVRQVFLLTVDKIKSKESMNKLRPFWMAIDLVLEQYIGMIPVEKLSKEISRLLRWEKEIPPYALFQFLRLFKKYDTANESNFIGITAKKCKNTDKIYAFFRELMQKEMKLKKNKAVNLLMEKCSHEECSAYSDKKIFDFAFIGYIIEQNEPDKRYILFDDNYLYNADSWEKENSVLMEKIAYLLNKNSQPAHISQIIEIIETKLRMKIEKSDALLLLNNTPNVLLWDEETYVHKDDIEIHERFLEKICYYLYGRLSSGLPVMHISGIYDKFKKRCFANNIFSNIALYSSLIKYDNPDLIFPSYPEIYLREGYTHRKLFMDFIEEYLFSQNGPILLREFNYYFKIRIRITSYHLNRIVENSENVIMLDHKMIAHKIFSRFNRKNNRIKMSEAARETILFKEYIFNSTSIKNIKIAENKYLVFSGQYGEVFIPDCAPKFEERVLKYRIYQAVLNVKYTKDILGSDVDWNFPTIIDLNWEKISDTLFFTDLEVGKVIISIGNKNNIETIKSVIFKTPKKKSLDTDKFNISDFDFSENQKKVLDFFESNDFRAHYIKFKLFCRMHNIDMEYIIDDINREVEKVLAEKIILSNEKTLFINENFLK